jgi:hypothetical protein
LIQCVPFSRVRNHRLRDVGVLFARWRVTYHLVMSLLRRLTIAALALAGAACASSRPRATDTNAGIDSLNARLVSAYRARDAQAYAALYTDSAVFEWPAFNTVRGPAALAGMARDN